MCAILLLHLLYITDHFLKNVCALLHNNVLFRDGLNINCFVFQLSSYCNCVKKNKALKIAEELIILRNYKVLIQADLSE